MIQANELRIGNWIYWNIPEKMQFKCADGTIESVPHKVIAILDPILHTKPLSLGKTDKGDYIGIPLTEDWLVRFGLEKLKVLEFTYSCFSKWCGTFGVVVTLPDMLFGVENEDVLIYTKKINYVHQLQNLYFALTGEELKLKEQ